MATHNARHQPQHITYPRPPQQREELAALDKVHDHVQVPGILKGTPQRDQERVLHLAQHLALVVCVLDLLHLDHLRLLEHLDGVEPVVVVRLHQVHPAEAAGPERPQQLKVRQRVFPPSHPRITALLRCRLCLWWLLLLLRLLLRHGCRDGCRLGWRWRSAIVGEKLLSGKLPALVLRLGGCQVGDARVGPGRWGVL